MKTNDETKTYAIWTSEKRRLSNVDGWLLGTPRFIGQNEIVTDLLHLRTDKTEAPAPVAFLSELNAELYARDMANERNDPSMLDFRPVKTGLFMDRPDMWVLLMRMAVFTCTKCGQPVTRMSGMEHGRLFSTIRATCPKCGAELRYRRIRFRG